MIVAQLRGCEFEQDKDGRWMPAINGQISSAFDALIAVSRALGFFDDINDYLSSLCTNRFQLLKKLQETK